MMTQWPESMEPYKTNPPDGAVAIVMPVRSQSKFVRLSYYAIRYFTNVPYMFVFVNNQSDLETKNIMTGLSKNHHVWLLDKHIDFDKGSLANFGFKFCFDQSRNIKYGLLIDSDVIVEPNWLENLIKHMDRFHECGVVSPSMNRFPNNSYGRTTGSCMLFRRDSFEKINGFDEGLGDLEDTSFCKRIEKLGLTCDSTPDAYVHHFGSATRDHISNK